MVNTSVKAFCCVGLRVFLCVCVFGFRKGEVSGGVRPQRSGEVGRELTLTLVIGQQAVDLMSYSGRVLKHVHCLSFPWSIIFSLNVAFIIVGQQKVQEVLVQVILIEHLAVKLRHVETLPVREAASRVVIIIGVVVMTSTESRKDERGQPSSQGRVYGC
jgi:hypothetical protein